MTQKCCKHAQSQQSHAEQNDSGKQREYQRRFDVTDMAAARDVADRGRRHQRYDSDWPDRQRAARTKNGVRQQRRDAGIQTDLRRQAGEHCIRETLRDEHEHDDECGKQVVRQRDAVVFARVTVCNVLAAIHDARTCGSCCRPS